METKFLNPKINIRVFEKSLGQKEAFQVKFVNSEKDSKIIDSQTIANLKKENSLTQEENLQEINSKQFQKFLEKINQVLLSLNKALKIEIDKDLNIPIYKIIDLQTQEVLKQIPIEELLKLKKAIAEILAKENKSSQELKGLFIKLEV